MKNHPYLRAYMAGIAIPTMFLLVGITGFSLLRSTGHIRIPLERVIIFPMAVVPNLWGAWNMLYLWIHSRRGWPIGLHGAALVFVLAPAGYLIQRLLGLMVWNPELFSIGFPIGVIVYYLLWKYVVNFFNQMLGIA